MQGPFAPFSIIFTRAIRLLDVTDLARLNLFAASLQPEVGSAESVTHPYRLYELLCQAAQLHFDWRIPFDGNTGIVDTVSPSQSGFEFPHIVVEGSATTGDMLASSGSQPDRLSDWYYSNQQIMGLFEDDTIF